MPAAPNPALPSIYTIRGQRAMLDADLAQLFGVTTMVFNQAIKRNLERFPKILFFSLPARSLPT